MSFVLTGLPPTPARVRRFREDYAADPDEAVSVCLLSCDMGDFFCDDDAAWLPSGVRRADCNGRLTARVLLEL